MIADTTDISAFIARWRASGASERANSQIFLTELCLLLGVEPPRPAGADESQNDYTFERGVDMQDLGRTRGSIDLYKRGSFVLEAKQGSDQQPVDIHPYTGDRTRLKAGTATRETRNWGRAMERAFNQAHTYARALPAEDGWPPFLIVVDVGYCIDLYADFARQGKVYLPFPDANHHRIFLEDLADPDIRERLRLVWTDPLALDPTRRTARVTRELAAKLAELARSLESDYPAEFVARFLMRCLFTMFAEDVGLLPKQGFLKLLNDLRERPEFFVEAMEDLWRRMNDGGYAPVLKEKIPQFNGGLFAENTSLALSPQQIDLLIRAADYDWTDVEPAIFGTLLERALDPRERHKLGAHFTPRAYVERLVLPTVIEPLIEEWKAVQAAAALLEETHTEEAARQQILDFHRRLCSLRVLDPACGSGNFLYVALEHLKRLEAEVIRNLETYAGQQTLDMTGGHTVSPEQFLGIEVNPRAAAIAEVVLWIGYLQWHFRNFGDARRLDPPILKKYRNIESRDAVLDYDERIPRLDESGNEVTRWDGITTKPHPVTASPVPDESARTPIFDYVNPRPAEWPDAEFIVGNPPFVGSQVMREALGDGYTEALRKAYRGRIAGSADFVMYWWDKAAKRVRAGETEQFGFITTNSLPQTFNRRVAERHLSAEPPIHLVYAIPDHPWVDEFGSAAVRIAMTVGKLGDGVSRLAQVIREKPTTEIENSVDLNESTGRINADLTIGADVASLKPLKSNRDLCFMGVKLVGDFVVTEEEAYELGLGSVPGIEKYLPRFRNGRDLTSRLRGVRVIDVLGLEPEEIANQYPRIYQWLVTRVKPIREQNRDAWRRKNWWLHGRTIENFRESRSGLMRYIATPAVSKHSLFIFLDGDILPDGALINTTTDDAYHLGVLSSHTHTVFALVAGGRLGVGNDPVYNSTRCFQPFPFPAATEDQQQEIRELGERLDAHRKRVQEEHEDLTLTGLYNVLEKVKAEEPLDDKERDIYERGLVGVLKDIHDRLDAAVARAYGWPTDLSDEEILERLVALNHERAAEEEKGHIRWLRPEFQAPETVQAELSIDAAPSTGSNPVPGTQPRKLDWPRDLPQRMRAVQQLLTTESIPRTPDAVAARFKRARVDDVKDILAALTALGLTGE